MGMVHGGLGVHVCRSITTVEGPAMQASRTIKQMQLGHQEQLLQLTLWKSTEADQEEFLKLPSSARLLVVLSSPELALVRV